MTASQSTSSPYRRILESHPNARFLILGPRHPDALKYDTPQRDVAKVPLNGKGIDTVKQDPVPLERIEEFAETHFIGLIPGTCGVCFVDLDESEHFDFLAERFPGAPCIPSGTDPRRGHFIVRIEDNIDSIGNGKIYNKNTHIGEVRAMSGYVALWNPEAAADAILDTELHAVRGSKALGLTRLHSNTQTAASPVNSLSRSAQISLYVEAMRASNPGDGRREIMLKGMLLPSKEGADDPPHYGVVALEPALRTPEKKECIDAYASACAKDGKRDYRACEEDFHKSFNSARTTYDTFKATQSAHKKKSLTDADIRRAYDNAHNPSKWIAGIRGGEDAKPVWYQWTGKYWRENATGGGLYRTLCDLIENIAPASANDAKIISVMRHLKMYNIADLNTYDNEPLMLNTRSGVVDLSSGEIAPHRIEQKHTMITGCRVDGESGCPLWEKSICEWVGHDSALAAYVKRITGYFLRGDNREHKVFFISGTGKNGKSTFTNVIEQLLGSYYTAIDKGTFKYTHNEQHPTGMADVAGRRVGAISELPENGKLDSERVKQVSGGDTIRARKMGQNFFSFHPKIKLLFAVNDMPISEVGPAMERRIEVIPFDTVIKEEDRDPDLHHKLMKELPAILNWAIEGHLEYLQKGLSSPQAVTEATQEYFQDQDYVAQFILDLCKTMGNAISRKEMAKQEDPIMSEESSLLHLAYKGWCTTNGHHAKTQTSFGKSLNRLGYYKMAKRPRGEGIRRVGIRLMTEADSTSTVMMLARQQTEHQQDKEQKIQDQVNTAQAATTAKGPDVPF